jgi:hypothetical protein
MRPPRSMRSCSKRRACSRPRRTSDATSTFIAPLLDGLVSRGDRIETYSETSRVKVALQQLMNASGS